MSRRLILIPLLLAVVVITAPAVAAQDQPGDVCSAELLDDPTVVSCTVLPDGSISLVHGDVGIGLGPTAPDPGIPGEFGLFIVFALLLAAAGGIWKFTRLRDMGINQGMSDRDATTMAMFSDDPAVTGMIVGKALRPRRAPQAAMKPTPRPEPEPTAPAPAPAPAPEATIEERLERVAQLRTKGLITAAEAEERRAEILDEI